MSITATALTAAMTATDNRMAVSSGTGFPSVGTIANPGYLVKIGSEYMLARSQPVSGTIEVYQRGYDGTVAQAHDTLSKVEVSSVASDFPPVPAAATVQMPDYTPVQINLGQDTTFTANQILSYGNRAVQFPITKATAAAITLVAPSKAQDGLEITFTSLTAAAHVITATSLLGDAVSGSPHTTATFAAYIGTTITLIAENGIWNVKSSTGVTIT